MQGDAGDHVDQYARWLIRTLRTTTHPRSLLGLFRRCPHHGRISGTSPIRGPPIASITARFFAAHATVATFVSTAPGPAATRAPAMTCCVGPMPADNGATSSGASRRPLCTRANPIHPQHRPSATIVATSLCTGADRPRVVVGGAVSCAHRTRSTPAFEPLAPIPCCRVVAMAWASGRRLPICQTPLACRWFAPVGASTPR